MVDAETMDPRTDDALVAERRRPGRRADVTSTLVPLLRAPGGGDLPNDLVDDPVDEWSDDWAGDEKLAPSRSIALALAICVPVWCLVGGLLYTLLA